MFCVVIECCFLCLTCYFIAVALATEEASRKRKREDGLVTVIPVSSAPPPATSMAVPPGHPAAAAAAVTVSAAGARAAALAATGAVNMKSMFYWRPLGSATAQPVQEVTMTPLLEQPFVRACVLTL